MRPAWPVRIGFCLAALLALPGLPGRAQTLVEPAVMLDRPLVSNAGGAQGPVLIAGEQDLGLAVYFDGRDGRVHAAVVDGRLPGASRASIPLSEAVDLEEAALSAAGDRFLLMWGSAGTIRGQCLSATGVGEPPTEGAVVQVPAAPGGFGHPRVANGPGGWLVAFRQGTSGIGPVDGAFVSCEGSGAVGAVSPLIAEEVADFDLSGNTDAYALAHVRPQTGSEIVLSKLGADLNVLGELILSQVPVDLETVVATRFSGLSGWTTWHEPGGDLIGRRLSVSDWSPAGDPLALSPEGSTVGTAALGLTTTEVWVAFTSEGLLFARSWTEAALGPAIPLEIPIGSGPVLADGSSGVLAAYVVEDPETGRDVVVQLLSSPRPLPGQTLTVGSAPLQSADLTWTGERIAVAWCVPDTRDDADVFLTRVDGHGVPVDRPGRPVSRQVAEERDVKVAYAPLDQTLLVVWVENGTTLKGRLFPEADPDLGAPAFEICTQEDGISSPEVVVLADQGVEQFLVVFEDGRHLADEGVNIAAVLLPVSGLAQPDCGDEVSRSSDDDIHPQLATDGARGLVVWSTGWEGFPVVTGALIDSPLSVGEPFDIGGAAAGSTEMDLAYLDGETWLLAGSRPDTANGEGADIYLTRFQSDSTLIDSLQLPAAVATEHDHSPRVLVGQDDVAVVWKRGVPGAVRHARYSYPQGVWIEGTQVEVVPAASLIDGPLAVGGGDLDRVAVVAREWDRFSSGGDERLSFRQVLSDGGPMAHAGSSRRTVEGQTLTFDGGLSQCADGSSFVWHFDDEVLVGSVVDRTFDDNGVFFVSLTVQEPGADPIRADTDVVEVHVSNQPPDLVLMAVPVPLAEGAEYTFVAAVDDPGVDDQVTLEWDFGDGRVEQGPAASLSSLTHTYWQGVFRLCLTAMDKDGGADRECHEVAVDNAAPTVVLEPVDALDEGSEVEIHFAIDDSGQDPLRLEWDFGDGTLETIASQLPPYPTSRLHTYEDDAIDESTESPFTLCVTALDDDGASAVDCTDVEVHNVPPQIIGMPLEVAEEGVDPEGDPLEYQALFALLEPGADDLAVDLSTSGLVGVDLQFDPDRMEARVSFVPTLEQWRSQVPPTWLFELEVDDGDSGGTVSTAWSVTIVPQDENGDGLPDTCARLYGISAPGNVDSDGDGVSNADECFHGTDPSQDDRPPAAPSLHSPPDGGAVDTLTPALTVVNVLHGPEVLYEYQFEVYSAPELLEESWVDGDTVAEGVASLTAWVPEGLLDRQSYFWRVRVTDGLFNGPWMDVAAFTVSLPNENPTTPVPIGPEGSLDTAVPVFSWHNSEDADGDTIGYKLEIFHDAELTERERVVTEIPEGDGITQYALDEEAPLGDNADYYWRVTATDSRRGVSEPCQALAIHVDTANDLPPAPLIVAPQVGARVDTLAPELIVTAVEDLDGDPLTYSFVVSPEESFESIVDWARGLLPDVEDGLVHFQVQRELEENTLVYWRSAARDYRGLGHYVQGHFFVDVENDPPAAPTFQSPSDDQVVTTATPQLVVRNTVDPEGDALTYDFQVYDREGLGDPVFSAYGVLEGPLDETRVTVEPPLVNGVTHYARARAVDNAGALGPWSSTIRFHVRVGSVAPPSAPEPVSPEYGALVSAGNVVLVVVNARDTSGGSPTYEFEVYRDALLQDRVYHAEDVAEGETGTTSHRVSILLGEGLYYWHARADNSVQVGPWSTTWVFEVVEGEGLDGDEDLGSRDASDHDTGGGQNQAGSTPPQDCGCGLVPSGPAAIWLVGGLVALWLRRRRVDDTT